MRKLLARERVPLVDLLVVTDDFALPFGKLRFREGGSHGGHNGLRSIIDELGTEKFSRLRVGIGEPGERGDRPRPVDVRAPTRRRGCRSCSTPRPTPSRRGPSEGTSKAANRFNSFELQAPADDRRRRRRAPKAGEVGGPADDKGIRRTKTGWRRILPGGTDEPGGRRGRTARRAAA